jgi:putative hydrolase of the HAD superfamily
MITTVLFDYGGVIAEEGFRGGLLAIARDNGLDPDAFYKGVCSIIAGSGYLTGDSDEASFWALLRREYGLAQTDEDLRSEILSRFVLRPAVIGMAARLRRGGMRVGIISDQTNWLDELDRRDGLCTLFDPVFNSYHMHASKYKGDLFDAAAAQLGSPPESMLLVDDSAGNIGKARQRGFAVILYEDEQKLMRELKGMFPDML